jgi:hypothetical protein
MAGEKIQPFVKTIVAPEVYGGSLSSRRLALFQFGDDLGADGGNVIVTRDAPSCVACNRRNMPLCDWPCATENHPAVLNPRSRVNLPRSDVRPRRVDE